MVVVFYHINKPAVISNISKKVICLHKQHKQKDLGESWLMTRAVFFSLQKTPYPVNINRTLKIP